jgi:hypothetical protein
MRGADGVLQMADLEARGLVGARGLSVPAVMMRLWDAGARKLRLRRRSSVNQRFDLVGDGGLLRVGGELRELRVEIGERALQLLAIARALAGLQLFFDARAR